MKLANLIPLLLAVAILPTSGAFADPAADGKICTSLGKVHALRDHQLYRVTLQSIDGHLSVRRTDSCMRISAGKHVIGLTADIEGAAFPRRRQPRGAMREMKLPIEIEAGRTYTLAAQLDDRYEASWIPVVERVELWANAN
jgi:hypothetical protein